MLISFVIILLVAGLYSAVGLLSKKALINDVFNFIFIFLLTVFIGFRSVESGVDTKSYYDYFYLLASGQGGGVFEYGFELLTDFFILIGSVEFYIFFLTAVQLFAIYLAAMLMGLKNKLVVVVLFLAFLPGLDMLTNGMRNALALSIGVPIFIFTVVNRNQFKFLNFFPVLFHLSYSINAFFSIVVNRYASIKMNLYISLFVLFFFILWQITTPILFLDNIKGFTEGYGGLSKLIRYALLEKELLSRSVKLYFLVVSLFFSLMYIVVIGVVKNARKDHKLIKLAFFCLLVQGVYALLSFSEYSFRFMYLAYPFQIIMVSYLLENYIKRIWRTLILLSVFLANIFVTYNTETFQSFTLLDIF